ncbi:hypothetical protein C0Q70_13934 [Pomacea canaliculata]|uniref:Secreted protein n=1 Tax=Pomacea canaliculata TaxID=400727 RepID=A0A2T7NYM9_POMCA|nr:hypothetical protein C0Q70_13934 [Pomacea canaliculata]
MILPWVTSLFVGGMHVAVVSGCMPVAMHHQKRLSPEAHDTTSGSWDVKPVAINCSYIGKQLLRSQG